MNWGGFDQIEVNGAQLECASWGPKPGKAPTLVLLHEGLGCVELWRNFPEALAEATGFGVFAYSRSGHGKSDAAELPLPIDYMTREATQVLPHVLDAAGIQRCVLLGHSDGATIAAIYAGSVFDARVRALVLMAPHFFTEEVGLSAIAKARDAFLTGDLEQRMAKYHRDARATFFGWNDVWLNPDFRDWEVGEVIDYFRIPTLALQGRDDEYGTTAQIDEIVTRSYAPVEVELLDQCGHSPHIDQIESTTRAITSFVQQLEQIELTEVKTT